MSKIARAYTAGRDGYEGYYGVIVFANGKRERVIDRSPVYSGPNVEPYWTEGNFDTRAQAKAATYRRIRSIKDAMSKM